MQGHRVTAAVEARQALELLGTRAGEAALRPDLVILDFGLGAGINGYQLAAALRQRDELRQVPLVMVTGTTKQIRDLIELEGVYFIHKPFLTGVLLATIERALSGAKPSMSRVLVPEPVDLLPAAGSGADEPPRSESPEPPRPPIIERFERPAPPAPPMRPAPPAAAVVESRGPADAISAESPIAELVNQIVTKALNQGASDIHFEPQRDCLCVRTRVDGVLQPLGKLPIESLDKVCVRIKILCNLNITEKRLPQDGQFAARKPDGQTAKFRVSTLPSLYGEKIVIRLLSADSLQVKLDSLGFSPRCRAQIHETLQRPTGLILTTGPTGSGKTTTLYTMLDMLNNPQRNIVTVEDPVEYQLPGITQVQVNAAVGYTFDRVLRSLLRQDPNVVLIGEIRDAETAEIALKAAVTGHMVLSTLHTNDAPSAVYRLLSMGLPAYLVAAACRMVISQRLVRLLCPKCRVAGTLTPEEECQLAPEERPALKTAWRARGCPDCHGIGYSGRKAIGEIMPTMSFRIHEAIVGESNPDQLRALALEEGMIPMRQEALAAAAEGLTSPEEAFKALYL